MSLVCSCNSMSKRASEHQEAMVEVVPTEGRDRRRIVWVFGYGWELGLKLI